MSSPLSSLKKGARSPNLPGHIPGHRPIPFRHPEYSEDESRLLEEITMSMATTRLKARDPFSGGLPTMASSPNPTLRAAGNNNADDGNSSDSDGGLPPPTDRELMKLMMARLAIMEQKIQQQEQDIRTKDRRIKILEDKLRIVGKARREDLNNSNGELDGEGGGNKGGNSNNSQQRVQELEQHCLLLQQQVHEMETFLADYGMVWVGEQDDPESDIYVDDNQPDTLRKERQAECGLTLEDAEHTTGQPFAINFDLLMDNIRDLNVIAGEGENRIQHTTDGARFARQRHVPITFYANGLLMFDGPFRPYTDPATVQCVQDFLDGYFPSELQSRYPEGVPFSVRDMRSVAYKPRKGTDVFSGAGMTLGGEVQPSRLIPTKLRGLDKTQHAATSQGPGEAGSSSDPLSQPVKVGTFLNSLPRSVVRDGKVIDIRDSVGKVLTGETGSDRPLVEVVETAVTKNIQKAIAEARAERPKTPRDITTLRIKSEDGSHTYIVKMKFKETVAELRKYLDSHRGAKGDQYDICSTYPRKLFADDAATMEASGLVPNGVLHLQSKKKS